MLQRNYCTFYCSTTKRGNTYFFDSGGGDLKMSRFRGLPTLLYIHTAEFEGLNAHK